MKNNDDMKAVLQELAEEAMITGGAVWVFGPDGSTEQLVPPPRKGYPHCQGPEGRGGRRPESATHQRSVSATAAPERHRPLRNGFNLLGRRRT